jgi:hypothetical protein
VGRGRRPRSAIRPPDPGAVASHRGGDQPRLSDRPRALLHSNEPRSKSSPSVCRGGPTRRRLATRAGTPAVSLAGWHAQAILSSNDVVPDTGCGSSHWSLVNFLARKANHAHSPRPLVCAYARTGHPKVLRCSRSDTSPQRPMQQMEGHRKKDVVKRQSPQGQRWQRTEPFAVIEIVSTSGIRARSTRWKQPKGPKIGLRP